MPQGLLARGGFGEIHMGIDTKRSKLVAIKTIPQALVVATNAHEHSFSSEGLGKSNDSSSQQQQQAPQLTRDVFQEICAIRLLQGHANIVTSLAVFASTDLPGAVSLAFSYCPLDLHVALEVRRRQPVLSFLPVRVIRAIAHDMFSALQHCHAHGVLHRDVTPGNLLISYHGIIQLSDFGLAKPVTQMVTDDLDGITHTSATTTSQGLCTLYYRPPEVLLGGPSAHAAVDVYSAGLVLAELVSGGQPLFPGRNVIDQLGLVFRMLGTPTESHWPEAMSLPDYGKLMFAPQSPQPWTIVLPRVLELDHLELVLARLVALDPKQRWSATETLQSAWFQGQKASRQQVSEQLIPLQLCCEPLLMWSIDHNHAYRQAQAVAATRRSLLSINKSPWKDNS